MNISPVNQLKYKAGAGYNRRRFYRKQAQQILQVEPTPVDLAQLSDEEIAALSATFCEQSRAVDAAEYLLAGRADARQSQRDGQVRAEMRMADRLNNIRNWKAADRSDWRGMTTIFNPCEPSPGKLVGTRDGFITGRAPSGFDGAPIGCHFGRAMGVMVRASKWKSFQKKYDIPPTLGWKAKDAEGVEWVVHAYSVSRVYRPVTTPDFCLATSKPIDSTQSPQAYQLAPIEKGMKLLNDPDSWIDERTNALPELAGKLRDVLEKCDGSTSAAWEAVLA